MQFIERAGLCALMLGIAGNAFADKVFLKAGDVIEGNILNVTDEFTVIQAGVKIYKYESSQVDRVERDKMEDFVNPQSEELTEQKRDLIKGFLKVNGVRNIVEANIQKTLNDAPADKKAEYAEIFKIDTLIDLLIPVYANKFSTKDLEKLVNFFESPTGKRFVVASPLVLEETFQVIVKYFQEKSTK